MLVKILSISVLVELVILVGRDIVGKRKLLVMISKKLDTSSSELIFKRFKLRSPAIKMFFLFSNLSLLSRGDMWSSINIDLSIEWCL